MKTRKNKVTSIPSNKRRTQKQVIKSLTVIMASTPIAWGVLAQLPGTQAFASTGSWQNITNGAAFNDPTGVAVDGSGDVFVTNFGNNSIEERMSGSTTWTDITTDGTFNHPAGIAVDKWGNVYVANFGEGKINSGSIEERIYPSTKWTNITTNGSPDGQWGQYGIAVDNFGDVFVTNSLFKLIEERKVGSTSWSDVTTNGKFQVPTAIATDSRGNVFVADFQNNTIKERIYPSTTWTPIQTGGAIAYPTGIAVDNLGDLFVVNYHSQQIEEQKVLSTTWSDVTNGAKFNLAYMIAVDNAGHLFVPDYGANVVAEYFPPVPPTMPLSVGTNWAWNGQYGVPYNALQFEASSGQGPYTWSVIQGALPSGLKLSVNGVLSGTPTGPNADSSFTVQVTDGSGQTASKALSIQIWGAPPLTIQTTSFPAGKIGETYSAQLLADGG